MPSSNATPDSHAAAERLLSHPATLAVVGLSNKPGRASLGVSRYLQRQGYRIIPVHPQEQEVLGEPVVRSLAALETPVDAVVVFRRSELIPDVADEFLAYAQRLAARGESARPLLWLQEGITHPEAERRVAAAGYPVVSDRCLMRDHAARAR